METDPTLGIRNHSRLNRPTANSKAMNRRPTLRGTLINMGPLTVSTLRSCDTLLV